MQTITKGIDTPVNDSIVKMVGDYEVVDSGVFHTTNMPMLISINKLKLDVRFIEDITSAKAIRANVDPFDPGKLIIEIVNYQNESSAGYFDPIEIGSIGIKKYYFTFVFNCFVDGGKQLFYTVLRKG